MKLQTLAISMLVVATGSLTAATKGQPAVIFNEDFSLLTQGSQSAPADDELTSGGSINPDLMHGETWKGRGLHSAGGALAVKQFEQRDWFGVEMVQGYVQTPYVDVRLDDGQFTLRFKACALDDVAKTVKIELYDPYTTNSIDAASVDITSQWATYEVKLQHPGYGNHLSYTQMAATDGEWLIDDLEIEQDYYRLVPPIVHFPCNVSYEQFTGRWNPVPLATSYLVSVFSYDGNNAPVYLVKDKPTADCTMTVDGTVKGTDYYYTVISVNDLYKSEASEPCKVHVPLTALEIPEAVAATDVNDNGFVARWNQVFRAMGYIVELKREHIATSDEAFTVLKEDFNKFEGYPGYEDYPMSFYGNIDDYTSVPGWELSDWTVYTTGMFGLDNYWKKYEEIYLKSPVFDLSGDGGKFKLLLTVKGTQGDVVSVECGSQTLTHKLDTEGLQSFSLDFDNGTATTVFKISFDGEDKLLFDEIEIIQNIHAGDAITENVSTTVIEEPVTQYEFSNLNAAKGDVFVYTVKAWSYSLDEDGVWGPNVYSEASEPQRVEIGNSGVDSVIGGSVSVRATAAQLVINTSVPTGVSVYTLDGTLCFSGSVDQGVTMIDLARKGVLIVKVGSAVFKVVL